MIDLSRVTIIVIDTANPNDALKALDISCRGIKFGASKICTSIMPDRKTSHEVVLIPNLNYEQYSQFVVRKLASLIDTDFCLIVQTDGFVLNADKWSDTFFDYDYIGAKWNRERLVYACQWIHPEIKKRGIWGINPVGNGGFSLRSKKLLKLCETAPQQFSGPEDAFVCNNNKDYFESFGIKYAPEYIADMFSQDPITDISATFGFHGNKGLIHDYNT